MQKAEKIIEKRSHSSYAVALGAKAKAKAAAVKPAVFSMREPAQNKAWSETEEVEEELKAAMELDHQPDDSSVDETAGDFSDDNAVQQVVPKNRFGLPVAVRKKTALQLRLDQLDRERD